MDNKLIAKNGRNRIHANEILIRERVKPTISETKKAAISAAVPKNDPISGIHFRRTIMGVKMK